MLARYGLPVLARPGRVLFHLDRDVALVLALAACVFVAACYWARLRSSTDVRESTAIGASGEGTNPAIMALRKADQAAARHPFDEGRHLLRGQFRHRLGLAGGAAQAFNDALYYHPNLANAWLGRAQSQLSLGDLAAAKKSAERAVALQPTEARVRVIVADCYQALGRLDLALEHFEIALKLQPEGTDLLMTYLGLAQLHSGLDHHTTAMHFLRLAGRLAPDHLSVMAARAQFFERHQPKSGVALTAWATLVAANPSYFEARLRYGEALLARKSYTEALVEFEQAYTLNSDLIIALYRRAQTLVALERFQDARDNLYECIRKCALSKHRDSELFERCQILAGQVEARLRHQADAEKGKKP